MDLQDLRYEREDALAIVTLDRPEARNAYSEAMVESLVRALDEAEADLLAALSAGPPRKLQAMIDFNLGLLEERRGSTEAALEYFRRSAVLRPSKATRAKLEGLTAASACPSFDPARVEGRRHDGWLALHEDMRKALTADAPHRTVGSPASAAEARATLCNHLDQDRCTGTAPWVVTLDAGDEWGATAVAVVVPDGEALRASATRVLTLEC
ncbi:MAG: hypothetical protein KDK70_07010, partial [Myxococcales bacterium]|nr:hypothetical protein [Myxococcales bacterium]